MFVPGEFFQDESLEDGESAASNVTDFLSTESSSPVTLASVKKQMFQYVRTNQWNRVESTFKEIFEGEDSETPATLQPDFEAYELLIRSYSERIGKSYDAEIAFEKMKSMKGVVATKNESQVENAVSSSETHLTTSSTTSSTLPSSSTSHSSMASPSSSSSSSEPKHSRKSASSVMMPAMPYAALMLSLTRDGRLAKMLEVFSEMNSVEKLLWKDTDVRKVFQALHASRDMKVQEFVTASLSCIDKWYSFATQRKKSFSKAYTGTIDIDVLKQSLLLEVFGYAVSKSMSQFDMATASKYANMIIEDSKAILFTKTIWHVAHWYIYRGKFLDARNWISLATLRDKPSRSQGRSQMNNILAPRLAILLLELPLLASKNKVKTAEALLPQFYALFNSYAAHDAVAVAHFMVKALFNNRLYDDLFKVVAYVERALSSAVSLTNIYNLKLQAHVALDQTEEALKQLAMMQSNSLHAPNPQTSTLLISMAARLHGATAAHELLNSIIESVGTPSHTAFRAVVEAHCQELRVNEALNVLDIKDARGLSVVWDDYEPIMQLYERMNLLGKQFALYNHLLTQRLSGQPPSPKLTANLILNSLRQQYVKVANAVARGVKTHNIPISHTLASALLTLFTQLKQKSDVRNLAEYCLEKMRDSGGASKVQRARFGVLAIRSFNVVKDEASANKTFEELKEADIHRSIFVLVDRIETLIRFSRREEAKQLIHSTEAIEREFGTYVAKMAFSKPQMVYLRLKLAPKRGEHYTAMKEEWEKIVDAEFTKRERRAASMADASQNTNAEATSGEFKPTDDEVIADEINSENVDSGEIVQGLDSNKASLSEELNAIAEKDAHFEDDIAIAEGEENFSGQPKRTVLESSEAEIQQIESNTGFHRTLEDESSVEDQLALADAITNFENFNSTHVPLARPSLKLALEVLQATYKNMGSNAGDVVHLIAQMTALNLPPTISQHIVHAKAMIRSGDPKGLLKVLDIVYQGHFNLSLDFYHSFLYDIANLDIHPVTRHQLASQVLNFMLLMKGDRSPAPTALTWNLFLMSALPSKMGVILSDYTEKHQGIITSTTMESITRRMIISSKPLHSAVHDTFFLFQVFEHHYGICPTSESLWLLFSACLRPLVPKVYREKFFLLLKRLNAMDATGSKLSWTTTALAFAAKEAKKVASDVTQNLRVRSFKSAPKNIPGLVNSQESRDKIIDSMLQIEWGPLKTSTKSIANYDHIPTDAYDPINSVLLNLDLYKKNQPNFKLRSTEKVERKLEKRLSWKQKMAEEERRKAEEQRLRDEQEAMGEVQRKERKERIEEQIKKMRLLREMKDPAKAKLLLRANKKFGGDSL